MDPEEITQTLGHHQLDIKSNNLERRTSLKPIDNRTPHLDVKSSISTPLKHTVDAQERIQFLREMEKTREELAEFKRNVNALIEQMDGISIDLELSKDRVSEIEQDLTATEEVNVNLQVLLEKAVKSQKESDVCATQTIRNMYTELASVVYENNQLQSRLASLESHQREQVGNVYDITRRMQEYTHMLEQAQGTIHMLQEPRHIKMSLSSTASSSRRTSTASFTEDDDEFTTRKETHMTNKTYIQSPPLGPQQSSLLKPQQGLRMLLQRQGGSGLGSLTRR